MNEQDCKDIQKSCVLYAALTEENRRIVDAEIARMLLEQEAAV